MPAPTRNNDKEPAMRLRQRIFGIAITTALAGTILSACGGGGDVGPGFAVTVNVSGLSGSGLLLQNNGGDTLSVMVNGVASFARPSATGAPYAITVARQPSAPAQACVVTNGTGLTGTSDVLTVSVSCRNTARFAYVANYNGGNVTQFAVGSDGSLSLLATPFIAAGVKPNSLALDPLGRYLYVANEGNSVSQYRIGADGQLTALLPDANVGGTLPTGIAVDPSGRFVYVSDDGGSVAQFSIASDGRLVALGSVAAGNGPAAVAVDPAGRYVYVANDDGTVSQFAIALDGRLQALAGVVAAGANPTGISIDPQGRAVYVTNSGLLSNNVSQYERAGNGMLSPFASASVAAGNAPVSLATDPAGRFAWVANFLGNSVTSYRVGADGALSVYAIAAAFTNAQPVNVLADPTGRFLYVTHAAGNSIVQFSIADNGNLTQTATTFQVATPIAMVMR